MRKISVFLSLICICSIFFNCVRADKKEDITSNKNVDYKFEDPIDYNSNLYRVKVGKYYGLINEKDQEIIPPIYNYIGYSGEGLIRVLKKGKWGYANTKGKIIIPIKYDYAFNYSEDLSAIKEKNKWAFIDSLGRKISEFKYTDKTFVTNNCNLNEPLFEFTEGAMVVEIDGKYGFIDNKGKEIIPMQYDKVENFSEGLAAVTTGGVTRFIDKKGKTIFILPSKYDVVEGFKNGLARICLRPDVNSDEEINFLTTGFVNTTGKIIVGLKYGYNTFRESDGFCDYRDYSGFSEEIANLCSKTTLKWGFIDKEGKNITSFKYDDAGFFADGMAAVAKGTGSNIKWGFIDRKGKEVIPIIYDNNDPGCALYPFYTWVPSFSEGMALLQINDKWGYIDKTGKVIIPFKYDYGFNFSKGLAEVLLDGSYGYIDKTGKEIVPVLYSSVAIIENYIIVEIKGLYGIRDLTGKMIVSSKYEGISEFKNDRASVKSNNQWGVIDRSGKEIINPKYDGIDGVPFSVIDEYF